MSTAERIASALEAILAHLNKSAPPPPLTAEQVAERLGCSAEKVYKEARSGKLKSTRVGRLYRFTIEAVAEYQAGDRQPKGLRLIA